MQHFMLHACCLIDIKVIVILKTFLSNVDPSSTINLSISTAIECLNRWQRVETTQKRTKFVEQVKH